DIDAIVRPSEIGHRLAKDVASDLNLDESWLNDDVKRFISDSGTFAPLEVQELEGAARNRLKISRPSASYLLAMKCLACRASLPGYAGDIEDIRFLIRKMEIKTLDQIDEHIARFYPGDALTTESRAILAGLLAQQEKRPT